MEGIVGAERVEFSGYADCVQLINERTRVTLGHHCGGRVLEYALDGVNALFLDPAQAGWVYESGQPAVNPCGGRFDIGPEQVLPRHPQLWVGAWSAEVIGPLEARLTSAIDQVTGVRLIRDFALAAEGSYLRCTQTIVNESDRVVRTCHWSRTFARGGGIGIVPLTEGSRYPRQYVMYGPGPVINFRPEDTAIRVGHDYLEVLGPPQFPKLGFDSSAGWFGYLLPEGTLFVKRFATYPDRVYAEVAGLTSCIFYPQADKVELEPIGPREVLGPREQASFTEEWWLVPFPFPSPGQNLDLAVVGPLVAALT